MLFESQRLSRVVRKLLEAAFVIGIPLTLGTPFLLKDYYRLVYWMATRQSGQWFMIVLLMSTGLMLLLIVYEARRILLTVDDNRPFVRENVGSLQRIAVSSMLIGAAYIVKSVLYPSFLTIVIALMTLVIGLFVGVMARLFDQAVTVKEENDLTV